MIICEVPFMTQNMVEALCRYLLLIMRDLLLSIWMCVLCVRVIAFSARVCESVQRACGLCAIVACENEEHKAVDTPE